MTDPAERLRAYLCGHRDTGGLEERLLDAALAAAYQRGRDEALNVLRLAHAIDAHTERFPAGEPIHDEGTCGTDCAGDIAAMYDAQADR